MKILANIVSAMEKQYPSLCVFEMAVLERAAHPSVTGMDWLMAVLDSAPERTIVEWEALLAWAGLDLGNVRSIDGGGWESVGGQISVALKLRKMAQWMRESIYSASRARRLTPSQ